MQNININYIIGVFLVAALGWLGYVIFQGDEVNNTSKTAQENYMATQTQNVSAESPAATNTNITEPKKVEKKDMNKEIYKVTMDTNYGKIVLELNSKIAPYTVKSFVENSKTGYYNGTKFHRVIKGFMIQGGDPTSKDDSKQQMWGTGGVGYEGKKFDDEIFDQATYQTGYKRGVIAMANSGPNTNGSQFFIMHADYGLPPSYTIFGKVVSGLETVDKIANVKTLYPGQLDRPEAPVVINSVSVE